MKLPSSTRRELIVGLAAAFAMPAFAQGDKVVRVILPNATGSGVDAIVRAAQAALSKALGHPVVIDNQPGAGGIVGLQALARSPADGYSLGVVSNNHVLAIEDRDVVIVEDIIDTGRTVSYLKRNLETRHPRSVRLCALLDKIERRDVEVEIDYLGFTIPDLFVVGYGLDHGGLYRNLPYIAALEPSPQG